MTEDWRSRWYAPKAAFGEFLMEDERMRKFVDQRLNRQPPYAAVARVEIPSTGRPRRGNPHLTHTETRTLATEALTLPVSPLPPALLLG